MQKYKLTQEERMELIPALSDIARAYYDEPSKIDYGVGICYNLYEVAKLDGSYSKMGVLMKELGFNEDYFEEAGAQTVHTKSFEQWEERAYMCLFLSEYLYDTLEQELIAKQESSKTLAQKAKDKLNELQENLRAFFEARGGLMSKLDKA